MKQHVRNRNFQKVLAENERKFHPLVSTSIVDDESTEIKTRIESAENIFKLREEKNEFIDFLECLQLVDKLEICILKNKSILENLNLSKIEAKSLLHKIEYLRNQIAHGNDYDNLEFDEFYKILEFIHNFIKKYENDELDYNLN